MGLALEPTKESPKSGSEHDKNHSFGVFFVSYIS